MDELVVDYPSIFELMQDLQLMGESNAILGRTKALSKDVLAAAAAIYPQVYGNPDGSVRRILSRSADNAHHLIPTPIIFPLKIT